MKCLMNCASNAEVLLLVDSGRMNRRRDSQFFETSVEFGDSVNACVLSTVD